MFWNTGGGFSKWNRKEYNEMYWEHVEGIDIMFLEETYLRKDTQFEIKEGLEVLGRVERRKAQHGGIIIFGKRIIKRYWNWKIKKLGAWGIGLIMWRKKEPNVIVTIYGIYTSPEESVAKRAEVYAEREKACGMIWTEIERAKMQGEVIVGGDWNARVGKYCYGLRNGKMEIDKEGNIEFGMERKVKGEGKDGHLNYIGRWMLEMLEEKAMILCTGNIIPGEYTFTRRGKSTSYHVIISKGMEKAATFERFLPSDIFGDHEGIIINVKMGRGQKVKNKEPGKLKL